MCGPGLMGFVNCFWIGGRKNLKKNRATRVAEAFTPTAMGRSFSFFLEFL
jgi:hypothetical protein